MRISKPMIFSKIQLRESSRFLRNFLACGLLGCSLGCFIPQQFKASLTIKDNWDYVFSYQGIVGILNIASDRAIQEKRRLFEVGKIFTWQPKRRAQPFIIKFARPIKRKAKVLSNSEDTNSSGNHVFIDIDAFGEKYNLEAQENSALAKRKYSGKRLYLKAVISDIKERDSVYGGRLSAYYIVATSPASIENEALSAFAVMGSTMAFCDIKEKQVSLYKKGDRVQITGKLGQIINSNLFHLEGCFVRKIGESKDLKTVLSSMVTKFELLVNALKTQLPPRDVAIRAKECSTAISELNKVLEAETKNCSYTENFSATMSRFGASAESFKAVYPKYVDKYVSSKDLERIVKPALNQMNEQISNLKKICGAEEGKEDPAANSEPTEEKKDNVESPSEEN